MMIMMMMMMMMTALAYMYENSVQRLAKVESISALSTVTREP
jgi:hypothetical protein